MRGDPHHAIFSWDVLFGEERRHSGQTSSRTRHETPPPRQDDVGHGVLDTGVVIIRRERIGFRREETERQHTRRDDIHKHAT